MIRATLVLALACACSRSVAPGQVSDRAPAEPAPRSREDFEAPARWQVETSDGVTAETRAVPGLEGNALELAFDFRGHGGYASAHRAVALTLPANYEISFDLRGKAPANDFQFKLTDGSGENVWWFRRADLEPSPAWQRLRIKKRQIDFAWGPTRDRELRRAERLEVVVAAGKGGGSGVLAIDRLRIRELPLPPATPPRPIARASASEPDAPPDLAADERPETAWRSAPGATNPSLTLDLGYQREFGGLVLRWVPGAHATVYDVALSDDGASFRVVRRVSTSDGGRDPIVLPESEARFVRLTLHAGPAPTFGLSEIEIQELAFGASANAFVSAIAGESPRGRYPRAFVGEQPYWTLVGVDGGSDSGLISEDGAVELGRGRFSVEPFVIANGKVVSWADVAIRQSLRDDYLPLPSVHWDHDQWRLRVSVFASGAAANSELGVRYELENRTNAPLELGLALAVRPFQVNPPTQSLNLPGGVSPIQRLDWDGKALSVNSRAALVPSTVPDTVELATFDGGGFPDRIPSPEGSARRNLEDDTGLASATLVYRLRLGPRERVVRGLAGALGAAPPAMRTLSELEREADRVAAGWREKLNRVVLTVPPDGQALVDTLRSSLAHILMSRDGPILKPGTRSYARSWIRDGAMMSESLLRLGHARVATEYLTWFAPHQFANGKIPCCVDQRGADPVPEHDSAGEFIFLVGEIQRFTRDRALVERLWPAVDAAARYLDALRQSERTPKNQTPERRPFYGLLPPSISHEGYSDKPAYSYWDDFWGLIGFQDAAELAAIANASDAHARLVRQRDQFREELHRSLQASAALHGVPYLPASADRGDFDPTSTTIALAPGREAQALPKPLLETTFERYFQEFEARRRGAKTWDVYTPYELRVAGTFVRLGARERALDLLEFFMLDRRPAAWNQWAEVVGRLPREPRFIGDMPHAWIASDYIRSVLDLFAYARPSDQSLVLAAGVPVTWWERTGLRVGDLHTPYGKVSYSITPQRARVLVEVSGAEPPGGFVLPWPWDDTPRRATLDGRELEWEGRELRFRKLPARLLIDKGRASRQESRKFERTSQ
jgi:hypothetical protein